MPKYKTIAEAEKVLFRVPKEGPHMNFMEPVNLNGNPVEAHWANGLLLKISAREKIIINRHFYDVTKDDLGRTFTGKVKLVEKTTEDGRIFYLLDFFPSRGEVAELEIKFINDGELIPTEKLDDFFPVKTFTAGIAFVSLED